MIERRVLESGRVRWRVRYRTPDYRQRSQTFDRRSDAETFAAEVRGRLRRGEFVDPRRGKVSVATLWAEYQKAGMTHLRVTTQQNYRQAFHHVLNAFGSWPVGKIEHADVAEWVTTLGRSKGPDSVRYAHRVLCLVLDYGLLTRRLTHNVARGVRMPARPPARERILTMQQVEALASRLGTEGDLVLAMALLGLRWSELAALKVGDVDLVRRRVRIIERATEVGGRMDVSASKSPASARSIVVPASLVTMLSARVDGRSVDELVFPAPGGGYLRNGNWRYRSGWKQATAELDLVGVTPHDLRRTFGSLARAAGADLRWIQRAMGHESITTTARIYAHLYDDELDSVAAALDGLRTGGPTEGGVA
jgi:integrase